MAEPPKSAQEDHHWCGTGEGSVTERIQSSELDPKGFNQGTQGGLVVRQAGDLVLAQPIE